MKKTKIKLFFSILIILTLCLFVISCGSKKEAEATSRTVNFDDFNYEKKFISDTSVSIRITPYCDIENFVLIFEFYAYEHDGNAPYYPLIETSLKDLGDVLYGEDYVFTMSLNENAFTLYEEIYEVKLKIKSGTVYL